ncbi:MAG: hypothetical protein D6723_09635 [Acidobacteria bacterium]|nr:MAG: hypothetical protein D6723_09635 [Acidobacteriota bacterium]
MKRWITGIFLALMVLAVGRDSIAQRPGLPPGLMAFVHEDSGSRDPARKLFNLWLMDVQNPAERRRLTNFAFSLRLQDPVWSKDYRQVAFSGDFNNGLRSLEEMSLYAIRFDGTNLRQLTGFGVLGQLPGPSGTVTGRVVPGVQNGTISGCIVSAQGTAETASCDADGRFVLNNVPRDAIWVRAQATVNDSLGGPGLSMGFARITVRPGQMINAGTITLQPTFSKSIQPSWSPDGRRLVLTSHVRSMIRQPNPNTGLLEWRPTSGNQLALWSGGELQPITIPGAELFDLSGADWSPIQDRIACAALGPGAGQAFLVSMNPDGSNARAVYQVPLDSFQVIRLIAQCRWSPDGRQIAFIQSTISLDLTFGWSDLFVINADGTGLRQLTSARAMQFVTSPSWSPDGQYLAFDVQIIANLIAPVVERSDIYALRVDGRGLTQLTNDGRSSQPAWGRGGLALNEAKDESAGFTGRGAINATAPDGWPIARQAVNERPSWPFAWIVDWVREMARTIDRDGGEGR